MAAALNVTARSLPLLRLHILRRALLRGAALASAASLLAPAPAALARPSLAPIPAVSIGVASQKPLGEPFSFTVAFDNTSGNPTDVGYGPILDLILPISGADGNAGTSTPDGITFTGATYLGVPLISTVLPFPDADGRGPGAYGLADAAESAHNPLAQEDRPSSGGGERGLEFLMMSAGRP